MREVKSLKIRAENFLIWVKKLRKTDYMYTYLYRYVSGMHICVSVLTEA